MKNLKDSPKNDEQNDTGFYFIKKNFFHINRDLMKKTKKF